MKFFLIASLFTSMVTLSLSHSHFALAQDDEDSVDVEVEVEDEDADIDFEESEDIGDIDSDSDESEVEEELEVAEPKVEEKPEPQVVEKAEPEEKVDPELQAETPEPAPSEPVEAAPENIEELAPLDPAEPAEPFAPENEPLETAETEPYVAPNDDPDLNYEAQLHDIFVNFYNSKTPDTEWNTLVGSRQSERYRIQSGDNLWDISKTLFGDGNYWPKIWSLNTDIRNPHLISPNNSIRFLLGDESEPPSFTVTENATEGAPATPQATTSTPETVTTNTGGEDAEPEIPPPVKTSRPVVKKLPPSLPEWQDIAGQDNYDEFGISYSRRKIADIEDSIPLASYIAETQPEFSGTVKEIEVGHNMASAFQYIYVAMKPGTGNIGDTYLAVANRGEVQSVNKTIEGFLGYTIDIQGEIQLVERVQGKNESEDGEMYRALVLNIVNPVGVGSILVDGKIENIKITEVGERSQVVAQITGGSFFTRRQVYGNESITYLNRGENDGLRIGQILPIRANRRIRNEDTEVMSNIRPIGWIRIVKTTPRFATGVIVRAWSDVLSGDLTGSGELLPEMGAGSSSTAVSDSSRANLQDEMDSEDEGDDVDVDFDESESF